MPFQNLSSAYCFSVLFSSGWLLVPCEYPSVLLFTFAIVFCYLWILCRKRLQFLKQGIGGRKGWVRWGLHHVMFAPPFLFFLITEILLLFLTMLCIRVIPCSHFWGPMSPRVQNDKSTKRRVMGCKLQLIYRGVIKLKDAEERKSN